MTTINTTAAVKITRAEAIRYAIENLPECPQDVMAVLVKIEESFTRKPDTTESRTAKENRELGKLVTAFVLENFDPEDLEATNARSIMNHVQGINSTQKAVAVARQAEGIKSIKVKGRAFYVPADVEVID